MKRTILSIAVFLTCLFFLSSCFLFRGIYPSNAEETSLSEMNSTSEETTAEVPVEVFSNISAVGVITENGYTNEWLGVSFSLDEGWIFATNEEISQLSPLAENVIIANGAGGDAAFGEELKEKPSFVDVYGYNEIAFGEFNVVFNYLLPEYGGTLSQPESTWAASFEETLRGAMGDYVISCAQGRHKLGDNEFATVTGEFNMGEYRFCSRQYFLEMNEKYLVSIMIKGDSIERVDEIAARFESIR